MKYRAECPPCFCFDSLTNTRYPYSGVFCWFLVDFEVSVWWFFDNVGRHFGAPRVTFRDSVLKGPPQSEKDKKGYPFVVLPGSQEGHFWVQFGANFSKGPFFYLFFGYFFSDSKKAGKMELPKGGGGGYAIRQCLCMFRKGRPLPLWLHLGLHFGVILGAKFATILLFGRPGGQNRLTKERLNK